MRDTIVLGERAGDLADELLGLDLSLHSDMTATVSGQMRMDGPLWRAILRAEAELLLADAEAMAAGRYEGRTQDRRRTDAFVLVAERLGQAANRVTQGNAAGQDHRRRKASHQKRRSA